MFWKKKAVDNPLGVPLGDLILMLGPTSIEAKIEGNTLVARHEHYTMRLEVVPPDNPDSENGSIRAVVRITTELPKQVSEIITSGESLLDMNNFAALGALSVENDRVFIGSRLTIFEDDDAWRTLHCPLLLFTTICAVEAILGTMKRLFAREPHRGGKSDWTESDFNQVEQYLSQVCVCTTGGLGFTAEFGLDGNSSAYAGDRKTALFQEMADQPHPELGGGLFCLLQMPHQISNENKLQQICEQLNKIEMRPGDMPPHFGAWCKGKIGNNPAYVSFFPNTLHRAPGIAVNAAFWALNRAHWANATLSTMGIRL